MIRMMVNHATSFCGMSNAEWWQTTFFWTHYVLCFFFFKAGYFNKTVNGNTIQFCKNKVYQLLLPYAVWGVIGCIVYFSMLYLSSLRYHHLIETPTWDHIWISGGTYGNPPLWFLLSFFACYVGVHLLGKLKWGYYVVVLFPFVSFGLYKMGNPILLELNNVFMCIYVFLLGHYWRQVVDRLSNRSNFILSFILLLLFCVLNVVWHGEFETHTNEWEGHPLAVVVNLSLVLCGLSGVLLAIHIPRIPVVNFIGQHSMVYFVAHYPVIVFYRFVRISFGQSLQGRWDDWILLLCFVPLVCSWLVPYVEQIPWLSGRRKKT